MALKVGEGHTYDWTVEEFTRTAQRAQEIGYDLMHQLMELQASEYPDREGLHTEGSAIISGMIGAVVRFTLGFDAEKNNTTDQELRDRLVTIIDETLPQERAFKKGTTLRASKETH